MGGVNGYLKDNLPGYQTMERQGSYALWVRSSNPWTITTSTDADIQIVMNPNPKWEAQGLRPRDQPNFGRTTRPMRTSAGSRPGA